MTQSVSNPTVDPHDISVPNCPYQVIGRFLSVAVVSITALTTGVLAIKIFTSYIIESRCWLFIYRNVSCNFFYPIKSKII